MSTDAFAVAVGKGTALKNPRWSDALRTGLIFGVIEALTPIVGWWLGQTAARYVSQWDHWIAFVLLSAIGGKMLWEARGEADAPPPGDLYGLKVMLVLAIATSIDAMVAGVTLPMIDAPLLLTLATIGITTALLSALGLFAGRKFGALLGKRLDVVGGVVLIGLGVKTLVEHLRAQ